MARPNKHTVDYFTHDSHASQGRTLSILFNNFSHEGLSAWWLLLETISDTENHVISIRNLEDLEYLASKLHLLPNRTMEVLKKMAELDALDKDLYSEGIIWCQNFVDRLRPVYESRKQELPTKPELSGIKTAFLLPITTLSIPETSQTKLKETIVTKLKKNEIPKNKYGEFQNVYLTDEEYQKLKGKLNNSLDSLIETMSAWLKQNGKTYKDYYAALLNWSRRPTDGASENRLQSGAPGGAGQPKVVDYRAGLGGPGASFTGPVNCPYCRGIGWVYFNVPMINPQTKEINPRFGHVKPCVCRSQSFEEVRRASLIKFCDLPDVPDTKTFENYEVKPGLEDAYRAALELMSGRIIFLTYIGPVNTGKTHLAIAVCHECIDAGVPAKFYSCGAFLRELKATFDKDSVFRYPDIFNRACTVPLLVLDDFYQGKRTEWMESELESLVEARYLKKLPTVFTTNIPLGEMSERIASRLQRESWCRVVILEETISCQVKSNG